MLKMFKLLSVVMLAFLALPGPALAETDPHHTLAVFNLYNENKSGDMSLAVMRREDSVFQKAVAKPGPVPASLAFKDAVSSWDVKSKDHYYEVIVVPDGSEEGSAVATLKASNSWSLGPKITKCEAWIGKGTPCTVEAQKDGQARCRMILKCSGKKSAAAAN